MGIYGRRNFYRTNIVTNPPELPYPLFYGRLQWGQTYNGETREATGSIEYLGVSPAEYDRIRAAYPVGKIFDINGISLQVTPYGYKRDKIYKGGQLIESFTVSISLKTPKRAASSTGAAIAAPTTNLGIGRTWTFADQEIISDGQNSLSLDETAYNEAELTWGQNNDNPEQEPAPTSAPTYFTLREPVRTRLTEESDQSTLPPENTYVLRDGTLNFDQTGEKKFKKDSIEIDGTPETETVTTYGFDYNYEDIHVGDGVLYSTSPAAFWKPVSFQNTRHVYKRANGVTLQVTITPPDGEQNLRFIVHPDFAQFAQVGLTGGTITFRSNAQYLVEVISQGWNRHRFKQEDESRNTLDPEDPYYLLFKSEIVPFFSRTVYLLRSSRGVLGDKVEPPFRIEFQEYASLEPRIRQLVSADNTDRIGRVAILYPDPNYVEPLFISVESSRSNSFAWRDDPESEENPDQFIPGTNQVVPKLRLTTGQESSNSVIRTVTAPTRYSEVVTEYSSQDPGFDNAAEKIFTRKMSGRPPEPQHRIREFEATQSQNNEKQGSQKKTIKRYFVSAGNSSYAEPGGSVSFPEARNLGEALDMFNRQLRAASLQNSQSSKVISWYYPDIRAGDGVIAEGDRFTDDGTWRVTGVSWELEYSGGRNPVGNPLVTTPGTSLTLGLDKAPPVSVTSREEPVPDDSASPSGDPNINVVVTDTPSSLGTVLPVLPSRRNF